MISLFFLVVFIHLYFSEVSLLGMSRFGFLLIYFVSGSWNLFGTIIVSWVLDNFQSSPECIFLSFSLFITSTSGTSGTATQYVLNFPFYHQWLSVLTVSYLRCIINVLDNFFASTFHALILSSAHFYLLTLPLSYISIITTTFSLKF